ncbi:MAG: hypothetical protein M0Z60_09490 [Nitrospiraceae bacterium]|nr:hypothetical protein [Nitrospiraceae bacterium]
MVDGFMMKFLEGLFYLVVAGSAAYGLRGLFRGYRQTSLTVIKAHITAYELQKMIEGRSR